MESPLSAELACLPKYDHMFAKEVSDWMAELGQEVLDRPPIPFGTTIYDEVCEPDTCRSDPLFPAATDLLERFFKVWPKIKTGDAFLIVGEGSDLASKCFMVANFQISNPKKLIVVPLFPCGGTCEWDLDGSRNLPWSLQLGQTVSEHGKSLIDFATDISFFLTVARLMRVDTIDDVVCRKLTFELDNFLTLKASKAGESITLHSSSLADLHSLSSTVHSGDAGETKNTQQSDATQKS